MGGYVAVVSKLEEGGREGGKEEGREEGIWSRAIKRDQTGADGVLDACVAVFDGSEKEGRREGRKGGRGGCRGRKRALMSERSKTSNRRKEGEEGEVERKKKKGRTKKIIACCKRERQICPLMTALTKLLLPSFQGPFW